MKHKMALLALTGMIVGFHPDAKTPALAYCVENQDPENVFFVIEPANGTGKRQAFWLRSGGKFCGRPDSGDAKVYVRVFESDEDLEGCSTISAATKTVRLDRLGLYDRCAWSFLQ